MLTSRNMRNPKEKDINQSENEQKSLWINKPIPRIISWFSVTFSLIVALIALVVAIVANCTANKASQIAIEVENRQLEEMQKRPFLSVAFGSGASALRRYTICLDSNVVTIPHTFALMLTNSGETATKGGEVILLVPSFLKVINITPLREDVEVEQMEEWEKMLSEIDVNGASFYSISFPPIKGGGAPIQLSSNEMSAIPIRLANVTISMPDTNHPEANRLRVHGRLSWPLLYVISTWDDDGFYNQRCLWVYYGIYDEKIRDSLHRYNWEKNMTDIRFRDTLLLLNSP